MIGDTIYAVSSPPGQAARGVVRLSGSDSLVCARGLLRGHPLPNERAALAAPLCWPLPDTEQLLEVDGLLLVMPGPASYTGEDVVELHVPGGPLLLETLGAQLVAAGARLATPGEFSRRAFANGRLSIDQAEGVLALIHATDARDRRSAELLLSGGLARSVESVRYELADALAMIEVGLDFEAMETGAVDSARWLPPIGRAAQKLDQLLASLPRSERGIESGDLLLFGPVNAGKSSLCNALRDDQGAAALVAPTAGTTRDVTAHPIGHGVRLLDAPGGDRALAGFARGAVDPVPVIAADADGAQIDQAALAHRDRLAASAGGILVVLPVALAAPEVETWVRAAESLGPPVVAVARTKIDQLANGADLVVEDAIVSAAGPIPVHAVSSATGVGLAALRADLLRRGGNVAGGGYGQHSAECLRRARARIDAARAEFVGTGLEELVAVELRAACDALDDVTGRTDTEAVLDRVFGGFCLGK